jgi:hypothetical protein
MSKESTYPCGLQPEEIEKINNVIKIFSKDSGMTTDTFINSLFNQSFNIQIDISSTENPQTKLDNSIINALFTLYPEFQQHLSLEILDKLINCPVQTFNFVNKQRVSEIHKSITELYNSFISSGKNPFIIITNIIKLNITSAIYDNLSKIPFNLNDKEFKFVIKIKDTIEEINRRFNIKKENALEYFFSLDEEIKEGLYEHFYDIESKKMLLEFKEKKEATLKKAALKEAALKKSYNFTKPKFTQGVKIKPTFHYSKAASMYPAKSPFTQSQTQMFTNPQASTSASMYPAKSQFTQSQGPESTKIIDSSSLLGLRTKGCSKPKGKNAFSKLEKIVIGRDALTNDNIEASILTIPKGTLLWSGRTVDIKSRNDSFRATHLDILDAVGFKCDVIEGQADYSKGCKYTQSYNWQQFFYPYPFFNRGVKGFGKKFNNITCVVVKSDLRILLLNGYDKYKTGNINRSTFGKDHAINIKDTNINSRVTYVETEGACGSSKNYPAWEKQDQSFGCNGGKGSWWDPIIYPGLLKKHCLNGYMTNAGMDSFCSGGKNPSLGAHGSMGNWVRSGFNSGILPGSGDYIYNFMKDYSTFTKTGEYLIIGLPEIVLNTQSIKYLEKKQIPQWANSEVLIKKIDEPIHCVKPLCRQHRGSHRNIQRWTQGFERELDFDVFTKAKGNVTLKNGKWENIEQRKKCNVITRPCNLELEFSLSGDLGCNEGSFIGKTKEDFLNDCINYYPLFSVITNKFANSLCDNDWFEKNYSIMNSVTKDMNIIISKIFAKMINNEDWLYDNFTGFMIDKNVFLADKVNKQPVSKGEYSNDILFNSKKNKKKYYFDKWISKNRTLVSNDGKHKGLEIYLENTDVMHNGKQLKQIFDENFYFLKGFYKNFNSDVTILSQKVHNETVEIFYSDYSLYSIDETNIFKYDPTNFFNNYSKNLTSLSSKSLKKLFPNLSTKLSPKSLVTQSVSSKKSAFYNPLKTQGKKQSKKLTVNQGKKSTKQSNKNYEILLMAKGGLITAAVIGMFAILYTTILSGGSFKSESKIKLTKFEDFYDNIIDKFFGKDLLFSTTKMYEHNLYRNTNYYSFFNDILYAKSKLEFPKELNEDKYITISGKNDKDYIKSLLSSFRSFSGHEGGASKKDLNYISNEGINLSFNNLVNNSTRNSTRKSVKNSTRKSVNNSTRKSVKNSTRKSVKNSTRKSVKNSTRKSVNNSTRKSVNNSTRKSVNNSTRKSVNYSTMPKIIEIEGLIIDYDPISNTHLFMRENTSELTEFCFLLEKELFYKNMISKKDYLYNILSNKYVLPYNLDAFFKEYENIISQFLDFGKMLVLTKTESNSINNLKNISIFGEAFSTSKTENNASVSVNNNGDKFYSAKETINSNNKFYSLPNTLNKIDAEPYKLYNLSIEMFEIFCDNYDKSLESYDKESINIDSLNEWGGSIV